MYPKLSDEEIAKLLLKRATLKDSFENVELLIRKLPDVKQYIQSLDLSFYDSLTDLEPLSTLSSLERLKFNNCER